jgi:PST family polysaccharide transporter
MKIDQIMLGSMVGAKAVGLYSSATRISEVWYFIPTAIVSSVAPSIYKAKKEGNESVYYQRITQLLKILNVVAISIAIPMTFFSGTLITFLFGNDYVEAGSILAIHIWSALFIFMLVGTSVWFIGENLTHMALYRNLTGAVVNVGLNLILIPKYQGVGAAIATTISYAISGFLAHSIYHKTRKIFYVQVKSLFGNIF